MRTLPRANAVLLLVARVALAIALAPRPAAAQFTRITALPATNVFAVRVVGDTIAAGLDSVTFVSVNGGTTWHPSVPVAPGVKAVDAIGFRNGRLYAGTFGQGVFVSDNLGSSWQPFNQGLVGGFLDTQLETTDLEVRGESLFVATAGAGVYVRGFAAADTWHHFGEEFEPNQASNVNDLITDGTRLLALAGGNGNTFHRDPGDPDWTVDFLSNAGLSPGLAGQMGLWIGSTWIVGTNLGVFVSPNGEEPWTRSTNNLRNLSWSTFAQHGATTFAAFDSVNNILFGQSHDAGLTWTIDQRVNGPFTFQLAIHGNDLYSAQSNGLWIRSVAPETAVGGGPGRSLRFALAVQPVRDVARFRFELAEAGIVALELFDVAGRRAADRIAGFWPAGTHELAVNPSGLQPGVYSARMTAGTLRETVRLIRVR
jgi:hypothetical protein